MSIIEYLHTAHKERLARIASRAYVQPQKPVEKAKATYSFHAKHIPSLYRLDAEYESAWFLEMADCSAPPVDLVSVEDIIGAVCNHFNVSRTDLFSSRRTKNLSIPRFVISYLSQKMTLRSLPEIGRRMGGRDHTSILHGIRQIQKRLIYDPAMRNTIEHLTNILGGRDVTERRRYIKITEDDVRAIRASKESPSELAAHYGCTPMNIRNIQSRRTWKGVA